MPLKDKKGIMLIACYFVVVVLTVLGSAFLVRSVGEKKSAQRERASVQAFYLAEAGLQDAHKGLRQDWTGYTTILPRNNAFSQTLGTGSFSVNIESGPSADIIKVTSTGTAGVAQKSVEEIIRGTPGGGLPSYDFAALAAGNLFLEGSGSIENQDVYVNGNLEVHSPDAVKNGDVYAKDNVTLLDGGSITGNVNANGNITVDSGCTITGEATSKKTVNNNGTITGTITSDAVPDPVDEVALAAKVASFMLSAQDWIDYGSEAQDEEDETGVEHYHEGPGSFSANGSYTGLHYVEGTLIVAAGASVSGDATFVVNGSVQFAGGTIDLDPASGRDYSLIIKNNVELPTATSGTLGGIVYCEGNFNVGGFITLEGAVICFGNLHGSGGFNIDFPVTGTDLEILSWREL